VAEAPKPEAPPPAEKPKPEEPQGPPQPIPIRLYDLITGIETKGDATVLLRGTTQCQIALPGITDRDAFALQVHDNTMRHTGTPSFDRGDVVVFSPNVPARSGDLAFVVTREGGLFRQLFFDANNVVRLRPLNSWYPEQCFHRGEVQGLWKLIAKFETFLTK
jgi:phage repressor protein C with HTH and peptisase S24 domain